MRGEGVLDHPGQHIQRNDVEAQSEQFVALEYVEARVDETISPDDENHYEDSDDGEFSEERSDEVVTRTKHISE